MVRQEKLIPKRKSLKFEHFSLELSYYSQGSVHDRWVAFLTDLGDFADYNWDIPKMQYDLVKSDAEWKEFLSHPDRQPFKLPVTEWNTWDIDRQYRRTLEIVEYSIALYQNSKVPKNIQTQIKQLLSAIIKGIVHSRYDKQLMELTDAFYGITPVMRAKGEMSVTPQMRQRFEYFTYLAATEQRVSIKSIRDPLLRVCQNNLAKLHEYFATCQFSDEEKFAYTSYSRAVACDRTIDAQMLKVGFAIWKELYEHGITVDIYLDILGYPNAKTVKTRINKLLSEKKLAREILMHFRQERPISYSKWKKDKVIPRIDISQEEARIYNFPTKLRSEAETMNMISRCREKITRYFPLSAKESPRHLLFNAVHPFGVKRAYQSRTQNSNRHALNVTVMTPTTDSEHDYLETLAHESTHAIHGMILQQAVEFNVLTKAQENQVPTSVLEDFSQLVEGQFKQTTETGSRKVTTKGAYFTSFMQGLVSWVQLPFSIVQIEMREKFEQLLKAGYTTLGQDAIYELSYLYSKKLKDWWEDSFGFTSNSYNGIGWFSALAPYDGLVYAKRFIIPQKVEPRFIKSKSKKRQELSMNTAFIRRFGGHWIDSQDARILLYWLLLETGRNHATESFGEVILTKSIRDCLEELQKIGISANEFAS